MATEAEMRNAKVPWIKSPEELTAYIADLVDQPQDYGTCVYAMSMAATAAFNYVAGKLGVTGFQSSCADMDILRRTRGWEGPAMVVDLSQHLYPQYDLPARVQEAIANNTKWFADEARKKLAVADEGSVHPDVLAHWQRLAQAEAA